MVDTAISELAVSKYSHTLMGYSPISHKEVIPMTHQSGCIANYANHFAVRSANLDWQIRTAMALVADRYERINNVTRNEAIKAYRFLRSAGIEIAITEDQL